MKPTFLIGELKDLDDELDEVKSWCDVLSHDRDLYKTINDLGGDAYLVEEIAIMRQAITRFMKRVEDDFPDLI